MPKPIRIFQAPLSGRYYAISAYKEKGGHIEVTGQKHDVTDDVTRLIKDAIKQISEAVEKKEATDATS